MIFAFNKKGFTLVELLIVIAVIGILASAVLIGLGPVQKRGRDAHRVSDLRQIQNALELYNTKFAGYPDGPFDDMVATVTADPDAGGVVPAIPNDPLNNQDPTVWTYEYESDNTTGSYVLKAKLEDVGGKLARDSVNDPLNGGTFTIECGDGSETDDAYCIQL